jgi:CRP-like cAMP-binding protein
MLYNVLSEMNGRLFKNGILRSLQPEIIRRLQLTPIQLPSGFEIEKPGDSVHQLVFIEDGVGSITVAFRDGFQAEVGIFGSESVIGAPALLGAQESLNRVFMQLAGRGFACPIEWAREEFSRLGQFHDVILRYIQIQLVQICQSAGCNAHHEVRQRLCRWLLLCADRSESQILALTQENIAAALGLQRSTVSVAAEGLQREGLIQYSRGKVVISDKAGMETQACECYWVVKRYIENLLQAEKGSELER